MGPRPSGYFPCEIGIAFRHPAGTQHPGEASALPLRTSAAQADDTEKKISKAGTTARAGTASHQLRDFQQ